MAYRITSDCIACGDCAIVCPESAVEDGYTYPTRGAINSISDVVLDGAMEEGPADVGLYQINEGCTGCGECTEVCPTAAIVRE